MWCGTVRGCFWPVSTNFGPLVGGVGVALLSLAGQKAGFEKATTEETQPERLGPRPIPELELEPNRGCDVLACLSHDCRSLRVRSVGRRGVVTLLNILVPTNPIR